MSAVGYPSLDIVAFWQDLNDHLVELVDAIPEDKLDWRPTAEEWGFSDLVLHIAFARHHWLANAIKDGEPTPPRPKQPSAPALKKALGDSWARLARFLANEELLARQYAPPANDPDYLDPDRFDGHFIAFHRLIHDAHHRADMFHLMAKMGVELPADRRRRPLL